MELTLELWAQTLELWVLIQRHLDWLRKRVTVKISTDSIVWVENFDEEDWKELLRQDLWEPSERDKAKLRVD